MLPLPPKPTLFPYTTLFRSLSIGDFLELGFEHMFLLLNSMNREVGEIFDTFVYTIGIENGQLSFATAVGQIGRAHVWTPVTWAYPVPSAARDCNGADQMSVFHPPRDGAT